MKKRFFFWLVKVLSRAFRVSSSEILSRYAPDPMPINPRIVELREISISCSYPRNYWEANRHQIELSLCKKFAENLYGERVVSYEITEFTKGGKPEYRIQATIKLLPAENPL
jgi:hypothetical protein